MKQKELREKVALLKDGQVVEIAGDFFQAVHFEGDYWSNPCMQCDLDSICRGDVNTICAALEDYGKAHWFLKLAHPL